MHIHILIKVRIEYFQWFIAQNVEKYGSLDRKAKMDEIEWKPAYLFIIYFILKTEKFSMTFLRLKYLTYFIREILDIVAMNAEAQR